jgi:predicted transcriptional regulator
MMAPDKHDSRNVADWHRRSDHRIHFCQLVVSRAGKIVDSLIQNQDWRHAFHDDRDSKLRVALESSDLLAGLRGEANRLKTNLEKFPHKKGEPLLVMVFDEASSLLKPDGSGTRDGSGKPDGSSEPAPGRYHALNRIISSLKTFPMWFFFLSTESQVGTLIPANDVKRTGNYSSEGSARIATTGGLSLERFPPFLGLQLDVEDRKRMLQPVSQTKELCKKMNEFAQPEHMAMFGRPLWFGYDPENMNQLAKLKLVGGRQGTPYDARDVHHVFAALSFRLSLDVCLQNPTTHSLARTAVDSFMRVVISMDQETGVLDTVTPSEPVVAEAAMEHLCKNYNWSDSIKTLAEELLDKGLIEKGMKGELYSRFILILARDWIQTNTTLPKSVARPQATFTVQQFLMALYGDDHRKSVEALPPKILEAWMNFNHFVPTDENLTSEVIPELLHDLLRRSAALQLAHNQPTFDKLIPIYFGNPDQPFDVSCCGVILVQDKNKGQATTPRTLFKETFAEVNPDRKSQPIPKATDSKVPSRDDPWNKMTHPVLLLLFDLGVVRKSNTTSALVQVLRNNQKVPDIWVIHSRGHDRKVFACLDNMNCGDRCEKFFTSLRPEKNAHYELCQRNKVFSRLGRNFRYSGFDEVHKPDAKRKRDGDEELADAFGKIA